MAINMDDDQAVAAEFVSLMRANGAWPQDARHALYAMFRGLSHQVKEGLITEDEMRARLDARRKELGLSEGEP